MSKPFVTVVTLTANRAKLLANCLACFQSQTHPADRKEMVILDDAGQFPCHAGDGWRVISVPTRFSSAHEKMNAAFALADPRTEIFALFDDDDIFLPRHLEYLVAAIQSGGTFSKPSKIYSLQGTQLIEENAVGRFCGSIAFTAELLNRIGGWPNCKRGDADQHFLQLLARHGQQVDPLLFANGPQYVYRYGTGMYHASTAMQGPDDTDWWNKVQIGPVEKIERLEPKFDAETLRILELRR